MIKPTDAFTKVHYMDRSEVHVWFKFLSFPQIILLYIIIPKIMKI